MKKALQRLPVAAVALCLTITTNAHGIDPYLGVQLDRIERNLVYPPDSYGFIVTDVVDNKSAKVTVKFRHAFFTSRGKVHHRYETFDDVTQGEPTMRVLSVAQSLGGEASDATLMRKGEQVENVLSTHKRMETIVMGQCETYVFYDNAKENAKRSFEQPFQMLANPCFAQLNVTPVYLRKLSFRALPNEDTAKVYEAEDRGNPDYVRTLKLYFSPQHGDALQKSEDCLILPDGSGEPRIVERAVRTVETWHQLPGPIFVPAEFHYRHEADGQIDLTLVREISAPVIRTVDPSLFKFAALPEFNDKWTGMVDVDRGVTSKYPPRVPEPPTASRGRIWLLLLNVAIVVLLTTGVFAYRQLRSRVNR